MRLLKASALAISLLAAMAVGVWIGPLITDRGARAPGAPAAVERPARSEGPTARTTARRTVRSAPAAVSVDAPELHARLKPLLNKGADMTLAARDFRNAEQFAAVAHAARNTNVPFMALKYRVLDQQKTLAAAIHESRPELNAAAEAQRARAQARSDIAAIAG